MNYEGSEDHMVLFQNPPLISRMLCVLIEKQQIRGTEMLPDFDL